MKRNILFIFLFIMSIAAVHAQEKKSYTLEDVIPGGNNYANLRPKNITGLQWWGDVCIRADVETINEVNIKTGKETVLVTLDEVNEALQSGEKPYKFDFKIKPLRTLDSASMPWKDRKTIAFLGRVEMGEGNEIYMFWYDFAQKKITNMFRIQGNGANLDFCKENGCMAYTVGRHLFVAKEGDFPAQINSVCTGCKEDPEKDVIYGQAVHRNEFGIYKGTFWSPKGSYLAFYRMDQSMVTDYPQVNTSTRIATLEPDKYPMAGMTSHKVTVGIYDVKSKRTIYLQTGDPTNRYFTNVSWSPDEKHVYIIELNRDQSHAQLVSYNAVTGEKETILYEEKHTRYVEPQHPLIFLPWDETKFIYQSQRDGFNHLYIMDTKAAQQGEWKSGKDQEAQYCEYLKTVPLTQGEWLVKSVLGFNGARKEIIITSTELSPPDQCVCTEHKERETRLDRKRRRCPCCSSFCFRQLHHRQLYIFQGGTKHQHSSGKRKERNQPAYSFRPDGRTVQHARNQCGNNQGCRWGDRSVLPPHQTSRLRPEQEISGRHLCIWRPSCTNDSRHAFLRCTRMGSLYGAERICDAYGRQQRK